MDWGWVINTKSKIFVEGKWAKSAIGKQYVGMTKN